MDATSGDARLLTEALGRRLSHDIKSSIRKTLWRPIESEKRCLGAFLYSLIDS